MRKISIFLLSSCCWLNPAVNPAHAQVALPAESYGLLICDENAEKCGGHVDGMRDLPDGRITVLANGQWDRLDQTGQTISILSDADLRAVQGPDLTRALERLPAVSFTRNGPLGSFTGLSVRGSPSEHVLVLVDGVRVNDASSPAGGFDFGGLVAGTIGRVELLRGSNSLIWGSDALGGVLHLSTRAANGIEASGEYGGDEQFSGNFALGHASHDLEASIAANYVTAEGFSSAASGTEADGFEQLTLSARGNARLGSDIHVFANGFYASGETEIDGFPAPDYTLGDTAERQDVAQVSASAGLVYEGESARITASFGHSEIERDLVDEAFGDTPYYSTAGRSSRADIRSRLNVTDSVQVLAGGEWQWSRFTDGFSLAKADIASAHGLLSVTPSDTIEISGGARYDHHSQFGGEWSLGGNARIALTEQLSLRSSFGEGFKAPSLFQLYSDFGNQALSPERSRSYDAGLDFSGGQVSGSLTAFRRDSRGLIDFVSCFGVISDICTDRPFGTYDNVGRARSQGVEIEGHVTLAEGVRAGAAYAYIESENRDTGLDLARRPNHALTLSGDWQIGRGGLSLGADVRVVSASFDNAAGSVRLDGYEVLTLRANYPVSDRFSLYGRVENVWDESYQTAAGYGTQGRAAFIGARAGF